MKFAEDITREWYNNNTDKFLQLYRSSQENESYYIDVLIKHIPKKSSVLDIGCGHGLPVLQSLIKKGFQTYGLDLSDEMVTRATQNVPGAIVTQGSMLELPYENDSYEAVTALFSLLHIPKKDIPTVLQQVRRVLKKDGLFLLSVTVDDCDGEHDFIGEPVYFSAYSKNEWLDILEEKNFSIIQLDQKEFDTDEVEETQLYFLLRKN